MVFTAHQHSTTGHVQATLHSPDLEIGKQPPYDVNPKAAEANTAQWSSGRILALGARDPRFEPGLGPSFSCVICCSVIPS